MIRNIIALSLCLCVIPLTGCSKKSDIVYHVDGTSVQLLPPDAGEDVAVIQTNYGDITIQLFPEIVPEAASNFENLVNEGYYDGTTFHRVMNNFMIQGGDPNGDGSGGEAYGGGKIDDQITPELHHIRGAVAYANSGPDTNGSQFYIVQNPTLDDQTKQALQYLIDHQSDAVPDQLVPTIEGKVDDKDAAFYKGDKVMTWSDVCPADILQSYIDNGGTPQLDYGYTVFGQVVDGMDVVDKIAAVPVQTDPNDPNASAPVDPVNIESITMQPYQG